MRLLIIVACAAVAGCATVDEGSLLPDGTVRWEPKARIRGIARDLSVEDETTYAMASATVYLADGTRFEGTGVVVRVRKAINAKGTTASILSGGAQLLGAAAQLSPF